MEELEQQDSQVPWVLQVPQEVLDLLATQELLVSQELLVVLALVEEQACLVHQVCVLNFNFLS